jgi:hypothetical protein
VGRRASGLAGATGGGEDGATGGGEDGATGGAKTARRAARPTRSIALTRHCIDAVAIQCRVTFEMFT